MNKLGLIIEREYLTRVKKKSFILLTLVSPLIFVALFTVPALLAMYAGDESKTVAVKDASGVFIMPEESTKVKYTLSSESIDELKANYQSMGYDGVLHIPALPDSGQKEMEVYYYSDGQLSLGVKSGIERRIETSVEKHNIKLSGYNEEVLNSFRPDVKLKQKELVKNEAGELEETDKQNSAGIATAIGFISGFIIYIVLLIYGTMIMRSVMEEKTNRIVEVIISSVRPFQLMLGKIIGVSAVGLTQMVIWIGMTIALISVVGAFIPMEAMAEAQQGPMQQAPPQEMSEVMENLNILKSQNWAFILPVFLFYFIGGYFIYSSLFAAVGSAMGDDLGESQPITFVAMAPIIIAIILISPVIENPTSPLATWMSVIPLFSPVLMPARLAFEPPIWELLLSMALLAASSIFFVWLSGRIYRVGILMYGKKVTLKELGKWMFYKE